MQRVQRGVSVQQRSDGWWGRKSRAGLVRQATLGRVDITACCSRGRQQVECIVTPAARRRHLQACTLATMQQMQQHTCSSVHPIQIHLTHTPTSRVYYIPTLHPTNSLANLLVISLQRRQRGAAHNGNVIAWEPVGGGGKARGGRPQATGSSARPPCPLPQQGGQTGQPTRQSTCQGVHATSHRQYTQASRVGSTVCGTCGTVHHALVEGQQLPQLHLHQLHQLLILHHVDLVEEAHDGGHAHLQERGGTQKVPGRGGGLMERPGGGCARRGGRFGCDEQQGPAAGLSVQQGQGGHGKADDSTGLAMPSLSSAPAAPAGCAPASVAWARLWQTPPGWRHPSAGQRRCTVQK